jgi:hypothetical protein
MYNDMQTTGILLNDIVTSDIHQLLVVGPQLDDNQMQYYGLDNNTRVSNFSGVNDTNIINNVAGNLSNFKFQIFGKKSV